MKRWIAILALLCALVLTGCGRETSVDGTVTAVDYDEDGIMTALTLCTSDGKTEQVELTESTGLFSYVEGTDRADIRPEMTVRVEGERKDGVWQADWVSITGVPEHGAAVLADGTVVDALHRSWGEKVYQLPDGTQLLRVNDYMQLTGLGRTKATQELRQFCSDPQSGLNYTGYGSHKVYVRRQPR